MRPRVEPRSRIVVAVDADTSDLPLEIARHLLRHADAELVGLFVEDERLFEHATAGLAREVAYSGHDRALEPPSLERQLRARAAEARRRFEASAERLALAHDFRVLRGNVVAELVREAASAEALVMAFSVDRAAARAWSKGTLRELLATPLPAVLVASEEWLTGRGVVAVFDQHIDARTLDAVIRVVRRSRSPLTILCAAHTEGKQQALIESVAAQLSGTGVEACRLLPVAELTLETLRHAARGARLLALAHRREPGAAEVAAELVARTRIPLLVVQPNGSN